MIDHATIYQVGDLVRYTDVCNDEIYVITAIDPKSIWSPYALRSVSDNSVDYSDLKQKGWRLTL